MKRKYNDCLTHCVAYYFQENPANIPFFIGTKDWRKSLKTFFQRRGMNITWIPYNKQVGDYLNKKDKIVIVQGISPRDPKTQHAVIYRKGKPIFDPSQDQKFIKGKPTFVYIITKKKRIKI